MYIYPHYLLPTPISCFAPHGMVRQATPGGSEDQQPPLGQRSGGFRDRDPPGLGPWKHPKFVGDFWWKNEGRKRCWDLKIVWSKKKSGCAEKELIRSVKIWSLPIKISSFRWSNKNKDLIQWSFGLNQERWTCLNWRWPIFRQSPRGIAVRKM